MYDTLKGRERTRRKKEYCKLSGFQKVKDGSLTQVLMMTSFDDERNNRYSNTVCLRAYQ